MISCYNVNKLPICEEGKQRSPWGAEVDFPSFPSGATFSAGLWHIQEPGSGLTGGSLQPDWWDAHPPCLLLHCCCASSVCCGLSGVLLPTLGPRPAPVWLGPLGEQGMGRGQHVQTQPPRGKGLVLAWRGCAWQTALSIFFSSEIWGFYCVQGSPCSSLVIQGAGEGLVYFHTAGILGGPMACPAGHTKWVNFTLSWVPRQPYTARAVGTCIDTSRIQVLILIAWPCLDLCLWFFFF